MELEAKHCMLKINRCTIYGGIVYFRLSLAQVQFNISVKKGVAFLALVLGDCPSIYLTILISMSKISDISNEGKQTSQAIHFFFKIVPISIIMNLRV